MGVLLHQQYVLGQLTRVTSPNPPFWQPCFGYSSHAMFNSWPFDISKEVSTGFCRWKPFRIVKRLCKCICPLNSVDSFLLGKIWYGAMSQSWIFRWRLQRICRSIPMARPCGFLALDAPTWWLASFKKDIHIQRSIQCILTLIAASTVRKGEVLMEKRGHVSVSLYHYFDP